MLLRCLSLSSARARSAAARSSWPGAGVYEADGSDTVAGPTRVAAGADGGGEKGFDEPESTSMRTPSLTPRTGERGRMTGERA
jgi:hypothetical protein